MRKPLDSIHFDGVTLDEAVSVLQTRSGVPIRLDVKAFETQGISTKWFVTLSKKNASLTEILNAMFSKPFGDRNASYVIVNGGVLVTSEEEARRVLVTRAYDINDLFPPGPSRERVLANFPALLLDIVALDSWRPNGGAIGQLHEINGILIVTQSWQNQEELRQFLQRLRSGGVTFGSPPVFQ